mmetsp:Transcript_12239/g.25353  ORF Transcript_12239/g.25353 Transcript_12239/m.25353 type:complete len:248 (+) Transcript_12239:3448-4191(+)|eukprot:CAMPEP_0178516254 /NCGR_PEP_ID=MMETSP0696-20121128/25008_1 /TAXON_ID=265572 /ORGANISM="Extubocellulus spinifer, Strain CCMP396" /LENGTH=247 /DNA_ID=CAMNT_0020146503 /DNA_START=147 /DNA_END=890 /DNA_ORIENTATION=-
MPKVSKVGRFRGASGRNVKEAPLLTPESKDGEKSEEDDKNPSRNNQTLSRGQRKRQAKREQYLKREKMVLASLRLKRKDEQRGKLDGLDALRDALLPIAATDKKKGGSGDDGHESAAAAARSNTSDAAADTAPALCATNRAKKNLAGREVAHMNLVLEHPAFKANPFETLQEHLRNTLSGQGDELKRKAEAESAEEKKKDAEKKKAKKEKLGDTKKSWMKKRRRQSKQMAAAAVSNSSNGGRRRRRR